MQWQKYSMKIYLMVSICMLSGCAGPYIHSSSIHHDHALYSEYLQTDGIAFLTPSTITGQEEDKQALAFIFSEVLSNIRPDIRRVTLPETLSAVNQAGFTDEYMLMYKHYHHTGIFKHASLKRIGELTGTRYVVQLKLAGFKQGSNGRFGLLGFRILDTRSASIRLFLQIWDTQEGTIAWEAVHEMNYANDTFSEQNITFRQIVLKSAEELLMKLPKSTLANNTKRAVEKDKALTEAVAKTKKTVISLDEKTEQTEQEQKDETEKGINGKISRINYYP